MAKRDVVGFTLASRVLLAGQRYRADEAPTRTAITVRFLAQRHVDRLATRARFSERRVTA